MTCRTLSAAEREFIRNLAATEDSPTKHAAFMYAILRERLVDVVHMAHSMRDEPLTEDAMVHIAEHWRCSCYPSTPYAVAVPA